MRDLSLHLMDILQNSHSAGATEISVVYALDSADDILTIEISDNGKGISQEEISQLTNPFFTSRTTRPVGLGLPLFHMSAQATGGSLEITSTVGKGTCVNALFHTNHINMIPLGNTSETLQLFIISNPEIDFNFQCVYKKDSFYVDTKELKKLLGDVPLSNPDISHWLYDYLFQGMQKLLNSVTSPFFL